MDEIGIAVAKSGGSTYIQLNEEVSVLASEADTVATRTSADQTHTNARGMILHVNTANKIGTTATYTPAVQAKFKDGSYATIWTAAAALTGNGDYTYVLYPGASGGDVTEVDGIPIPRTWRGIITVGGTANASHNMDTLMDASLIL